MALCVHGSQYIIACPPAKPGLIESKCAYLSKDSHDYLPPPLPITDQLNLPSSEPLQALPFWHVVSIHNLPVTGPKLFQNLLSTLLPQEGVREKLKANSPVLSLVLTIIHNLYGFVTS